MKKITLHLCGTAADHRQMEKIFAARDDVKISGTSPNLSALREKIPKVDLLVTTARRRSLVEEIRRFAEEHSLRIFLLAPAKELDLAWDGLEAGASGGALIGRGGDPKEEIHEAFERTAAGETGITPQLMDRAFRRLAELGRCCGNLVPHQPTRRELQILALVDEGLSNPQIGERLGSSGSTVKNQLYEIYKILGAHDRHAAVVEARRMGWLGEEGRR